MSGNEKAAAAVLTALSHLPYSHQSVATFAAELTWALNRLDSGPELPTVGPRWWSAFDEHARGASRLLAMSPAAPVVPAWRRLLPVRATAPAREVLPPFWDWALAVCAADGRTREAALDRGLLPIGHHGLVQLLVVRCADWVAPVRAAAQAALEHVLTSRADHADHTELAEAAVMAWTFAQRHRGDEALRIVAAHLADADPGLWQGLLHHPAYRVRRRALSQAVELTHCPPAQLLELAVSDPDVLVASSAAEHLLNLVVPAGADAPATPQGEAAVRALLASRVPRVRAAAVTVLRRAQRPDLAAPFTVDDSAQVREVARWVLRSHGQDPVDVCRARVSGSTGEVTPGAVTGLAECGTRDDAGLFRAHLGHPRPRVRAAALRALGAMRPPAITTGELLAVLDRDPAPGVMRTATALLYPDAATIRQQDLRALLAPGRPPRLRAHAVHLLRARDTWTRLEVDLRLLDDEDAGLALGARQDIDVWAASSTTAYHRLPEGQRDLIASLLGTAADRLAEPTVDRIRLSLSRSPRP